MQEKSQTSQEIYNNSGWNSRSDQRARHRCGQFVHSDVEFTFLAGVDIAAISLPLLAGDQSLSILNTLTTPRNMIGHVECLMCYQNKLLSKILRVT